ncbi:class A sortase [Periweissella cryptocerci]|uniref:Class A sortase n=1 Tax=Periweissella cryptocerci TaxID=2506420 RepID=A0A4P6YWN6_9LACO|nr:class A sortase [Periweissella cryptocerci]QBO37211.1 class A sortase [Periweissella cryptocerci]
MRRRKMSVLLGIIVALIGLVIIYVGTHPSLYIGRFAQSESMKYAKQLKITADNKESRGAQYNGNLNVKSLSDLRKVAKTKGVLTLRGYISIPQIEVKLPLYEGASNKVLALGAGTLKPGQHMGEKNYAIGAHNMADNKTFFSPLQNQLKVGMNIYLQNAIKVYKYQVITKKVIDQYQVGVIEDGQQNHIITLITCYEEPPYFTGATKRVYVVGKLIAVKNINE